MSPSRLVIAIGLLLLAGSACAWGDDDNVVVTLPIFENTTKWGTDEEGKPTAKVEGRTMGWHDVNVTMKQIYDDLMEAEWPDINTYNQLGYEYVNNVTELEKAGPVKAPEKPHIRWEVDPWNRTAILAPMGILHLSVQTVAWALDKYDAIFMLFYQWMCHHTGESWGAYTQAAALLRKRQMTGETGQNGRPIGIPFAKVDRYGLPQWPQKDEARGITGEWHDWNIGSITPGLYLFVNRVPVPFTGDSRNASEMAAFVETFGARKLWHRADSLDELAALQATASDKAGGANGADDAGPVTFIASFDDPQGIEAAQCLVSLAVAAEGLARSRSTGRVLFVSTNATDILLAFGLKKIHHAVLLQAHEHSMRSSSAGERFDATTMTKCSHKHNHGKEMSHLNAQFDDALQQAALHARNNELASGCASSWDPLVAEWNNCDNSKSNGDEDTDEWLGCKLSLLSRAAPGTGGMGEVDSTGCKWIAHQPEPACPVRPSPTDPCKPCKNLLLAGRELLRRYATSLNRLVRAAVIVAAAEGSTAPAAHVLLYQLAQRAVELEEWKVAEAFLVGSLDASPAAPRWATGQNNRDELLGIGFGYAYNLLGWCHTKLAVSKDDNDGNARRLGAQAASMFAFIVASRAAHSIDEKHARRATDIATERYGKLLGVAAGKSDDRKLLRQTCGHATVGGSSDARLIRKVADAVSLEELVMEAKRNLDNAKTVTAEIALRGEGSADSGAGFDVLDGGKVAPVLKKLARSIASKFLAPTMSGEDWVSACTGTAQFAWQASGEELTPTTYAFSPMEQSGLDRISSSGQRRAALLLYLGFEGEGADAAVKSAEPWIAFPGHGISLSPQPGDGVLLSTAHRSGFADARAASVQCVDGKADGSSGRRALVAEMFFTCPPRRAGANTANGSAADLHWDRLLAQASAQPLWVLACLSMAPLLLFAVLLAKCCSRAKSAVTRAEAQQVLEYCYAKHNKSGMKNISKLLDDFSSDYSQLIERLRAKYGTDIMPPQIESKKDK